MPLTPRFELTQNDVQVTVTISVPTVRITNIEVLLEDSTLHFHASPYLLKLDFAPHQFSNDAQGIVSAEYNPALQTITVPLTKAQPGELWTNLDLTARLLQPREIPDAFHKPWLHSVETNSSSNADLITEEDNDEVDTPSASFPTPLRSTEGYGFANMFHNIFTDYCRSGLAQEMLQLADPEGTPPIERAKLRIEKEKEDFDSERYVQDLFIDEDYLFPLIMEFVPYWNQPLTIDATELASQFEEKVSLEEKGTPATSSSPSRHDTFTADEKLQLATIPYPLIPKRLLPTKESMMERDVGALWLGLVDILVPFVYDHLTTMGDPTVESAWTITILSSSLSWLDSPSNYSDTALHDVVVTCSRRMLIYPYWRNWDFACHVWNQTLSLLKCGVRSIIKALLMARIVLEKSESYYVGNKLFLDPYLYWIQQANVNEVPVTLIAGLENMLKQPSKLKSELGFELDELERRFREQNGETSSEEGSETDSDEESASSVEDSDSSSDDEGPPESSNAGVSSILLDTEIRENPLVLEIVGQESGDIPTSTEQNLVQEKSEAVGRPLIQEL